jgi:hypothetical protein
MENPAGEINRWRSQARFRPQIDAPVSRVCSHIRCWFAGPSRTRRCARTDHDGRRDARRSAHGPEWPTCACRAFSAVSIGRLAGYEDVNDADSRIDVKRLIVLRTGKFTGKLMKFSDRRHKFLNHFNGLGTFSLCGKARNICRRAGK